MRGEGARVPQCFGWHTDDRGFRWSATAPPKTSCTDSLMVPWNIDSYARAGVAQTARHGQLTEQERGRARLFAKYECTIIEGRKAIIYGPASQETSEVICSIAGQRIRKYCDNFRT